MSQHRRETTGLLHRSADPQPATGEAIEGVPTPGHSKREDIQILRAIAVLLVVFVHAGFNALPGGFIGVDVFFVISGFVITSLMLREQTRTGSVSILSFYGRRARRILPLSSVVLIVTIIASYHWLGFIRGKGIATDGRWAAIFLANIHFAETGTTYLGAQAPPSPIQHFWSLGVEEQFYVLWPLLFLATAFVLRRIPLRVRLGTVLAAVMVASFVWSIVQTNSNGSWAYFSPFTRACELAAGAAVAVAGQRLATLPRRFGAPMSVAGVAIIFLSAALLDDSSKFPGYLILWPVLGTGLAIAGGTVQGPTALLGQPWLARPFAWIGDISFSLYLWHWPILIIAEQSASEPLSAGRRLALVGVAMLLSVVTYNVIENPIRKSRPLGLRPWLSIAMGVVLIGAVVATAVGEVDAQAHQTILASPALRASQASQAKTASALPGATTAEVEALVAAAPAITSLPSNLTPAVTAMAADDSPAQADGCQAAQSATSVKSCVYGDPSSATTVVLYGDSHAGMWNSALDLIGKRNHWKVILLAKPACAAVNLHLWDNADSRANTECDAWHTWAMAKINSIKPAMVLVTSAINRPTDNNHKLISPSAWQAGLSSTLTSIAAPNRKLVVIGDIPYLSQVGPDCLAAHSTSVQACSTPKSTAVHADFNAAESAAASANGDTYVDVIPWVCSDTCTAVIGQYGVYHNQYHLTATYAAYLSGALGAALPTP